MEVQDQEPGEDSGKLRRWVSNLQLESWQLELLITGFSIFLLASAVNGYESFRLDMEFNRIRPDSGVINPILAVSMMFVINTIPIVLKFLLINLLIHLLLRAFWIGIVGLSSVSSVIYFDKLSLRGSFKKFIPGKVKSLDELIVYLDKVSSVIFAYTYLLAFSIFSVVIIISLLLSLLGLATWLVTAFPGQAIAGFGMIIVGIIIVLLAISAILFFVDTLFFSTFKKSKWFTPIYYPIYRVLSIVSLSIIYRSIYYHLITNFKKKQIISVVLILFGIFLVTRTMSKWDNYKLFPENRAVSEFYLSKNDFNDTRGDTYINKISMPSKFVSNGFVELFIRYSSGDNPLLEFLCPESENLDQTVGITDGFNAGREAQKDSTISIDQIISGGDDYAKKIQASVNCVSDMYEIWIDDQMIEKSQFMYHVHTNKGERGYLTVLDIVELARGQHTLELKKKTFAGVSFMQEIEEGKISMKPYARLNFWVE